MALEKIKETSRGDFFLADYATHICSFRPFAHIFSSIFCWLIPKFGLLICRWNWDVPVWAHGGPCRTGTMGKPTNWAQRIIRRCKCWKQTVERKGSWLSSEEILMPEMSKICFGSINFCLMASIIFYSGNCINSSWREGGGGKTRKIYSCIFIYLMF